jgi:hypothetical protein
LKNVVDSPDEMPEYFFKADTANRDAHVHCNCVETGMAPLGGEASPFVKASVLAADTGPCVAARGPCVTCLVDHPIPLPVMFVLQQTAPLAASDTHYTDADLGAKYKVTLNYVL